MQKLKNDNLLRAIWHQPVDHTPIWIMRQAGRYLPEYRHLRAKAGSFLKLCKTPELACEVTLQPLARFPLDAAILFSDILTIPDAMGLELFFKDNEGPAFKKTLKTAKDIENLIIPEPKAELHYVLEAIDLIQKELNGKVPLIGFGGSPWTMATYMIEGKANKAFPAIRALLKENPFLLHQLLEKLSVASIRYLNAQIEAGVNVIMLFDTWGGMLTEAEYPLFSLNYAKTIFNHLIHEHNGQVIPKILFTKGGGSWIHLMKEAGCDVIGIDHETHLNKAKQVVKGKIALQGNLDPNVLYQSDEVIKKSVVATLRDYGKGSGHIFNLGHGIPKDVCPEKVAVLVETVHTESRAYHLNHDE